jgi:hypothetical protein
MRLHLKVTDCTIVLFVVVQLPVYMYYRCLLQVLVSNFLRELAMLSTRRGVSLARIFTDHDRTRRGTVTVGQLERTLDAEGIPADTATLQALARKFRYTSQSGGMISYRAFLSAADAATQVNAALTPRTAPSTTQYR